jgi:xanthine dehydrogenase iron-sulfur cluster and FAD-binding subunit A
MTQYCHSSAGCGYATPGLSQSDFDIFKLARSSLASQLQDDLQDTCQAAGIQQIASTKAASRDIDGELAIGFSEAVCRYRSTFACSAEP